MQQKTETIKHPLMLMDWNYQNVHNNQSNLEIQSKYQGFLFSVL